jgi:hypothetical protein
MTRVSPPSPPRANGDRKHDAGSTAAATPAVTLNGRQVQRPAEGKASEKGLRPGSLRGRRRKSLVSLASSDDLLGRRMKGLAGGLMGLGEDDAPPTP